MARRAIKSGLSLEQEAFCRHYVSPGEFYGNGVQAYASAYNIDLSKPGQYKVAVASASRLLSTVNINKRINELLDKSGFNAEHADKRLLHWINQNQDGNVSVR